jgi:hypothetical protein
MTARMCAGFDNGDAMPVGKAQRIEQESRDGWVVPCFTRIDPEEIRARLADGHFSWLDLTAPTHEDRATLREITTDAQLARLFALKRQLVAMRKVITPQRVNRIGHGWAFWGLGVGSLVATGAALLFWFQRRGWL